MTTKKMHTPSILKSFIVFMLFLGGIQYSLAQLVHPGGWLTATDLTRIRTNVASGAEPWASAWDAMKDEGPDSNTTASVVPIITNETTFQKQGHDAFVLAIKWIASGDTEYATAAIRIIDAWVNTVEGFGNRDIPLRQGIGSNIMANAAELLAYGFNGESGWSTTNINKAKTWFKDVVYPYTSTGDKRSLNWGTSCVAGNMSMAIFCDDMEMFNDAIDAYKYGFTNTTDGCASVTHYIINDEGQCYESGRDQAHTQGGIAHLIEPAFIAWNQGVNLVSFEDYRLVKGLEYTAKYNLGNSVSWTTNVPNPCNIAYNWTEGISDDSQGVYSPIYVMASTLFEYAGVDHPYTQEVIQSQGYTPEGTNSDHPGLGNLLYSLGNIDAGCTNYIPDSTPPSNLVTGINYAYYEGTWDNIPDFNGLIAEDTGIITTINLDNAVSADYFGFTFDGYINISTDGAYTFYTQSDDGSSLWIDGNQVVNNDGLHGVVEKSGTICLEAGYHTIEVAYFEKTGGNSLAVYYEGPGISKTTISNLYAQGETTTDPGDFPNPNKTYYIDAPHHNLRLAATGESESAYTTSTSTTGADVEWQFVDRGNGYWHIQRAAGGATPRLRTDNTENADMQPTSSNGSWTYYDFSEGVLTDTYFLTLIAANTEFKRLQIDNTGAVKMVDDDRNGTWESFRITEASTPTATFYRIEAEDFDAMSGIKTENSTESGENVGWINNGDWLRFDDIDLTGAQSVDLRVASNFEGGTIQIRTASPTGTVIGSASVSNTGGHQEWITVSTSINDVSGVQDLYLVFTGGSGYLFNINWLEFSAETINSKNEALTNQTLIYPTLIEDVVNIKLSVSQEPAVIDIVNISGQVVASKNIINNEINTMNLEDIPSGIYIIKINDLEGCTIKKIVKQ